MPVLVWLSRRALGPLGCVGIAVIVLLLWAVSIAVWGLLLGGLLWNDLLVHHIHGAGKLSSRECAIVGFVASLVLG